MPGLSQRLEELQAQLQERETVLQDLQVCSCTMHILPPHLLYHAETCSRAGTAYAALAEQLRRRRCEWHQPSQVLD